jgi:hypothetical protein
MVAQYSDLNVPAWIIGEPLGTPGYDTKTRILKVWPNREPIQLKTANEFNEELDELLARHCRSEDECADDSMMGDQQIQWHPIQDAANLHIHGGRYAGGILSAVEHHAVGGGQAPCTG